MLNYWSVPDPLVTPGTESLTRHIDLLDAVTHTHLQQANLVRQTSFYFLFQPSPELHLFFTDVLISNTSTFFAFCKYTTKGWDLRPGGGQPLGSSLSKALSSNLQVRRTSLIHIKWPPIHQESLNGWLASDDWVTSLFVVLRRVAYPCLKARKARCLRNTEIRAMQRKQGWKLGESSFRKKKQ